MEAPVRCAGGPNTGGHPPSRGHGLLVPPHRPALRHQRPPRLAPAPSPGVVAGQLRPLSACRLRLLPRAQQSGHPPAGLPHVAASRQLAGAAGAGLRGWRPSAAARGCRLQRGRPLSPAHGCRRHRAPGAGAAAAPLRPLWRGVLTGLPGRPLSRALPTRHGPGWPRGQKRGLWTLLDLTPANQGHGFCPG